MELLSQKLEGVDTKEVATRVITPMGIMGIKYSTFLDYMNQKVSDCPHWLAKEITRLTGRPVQ